ncbi:hypothetical protein THAOC_01645, partial [Thalassiosira oceanica]
MSQFGGDFFGIAGTGLEVGHFGYYDAERQYWPAVFVITKHENKEFAMMGMKCMKVLHEHLGSLDGADAQHDSLECFAHVTRLPDGTRRNSKKGAKGSLARYLLREMKLSNKDMSKFVADVLYANYLTPNCKEDYDAFIDLLTEKYPRIMNGETPQSKHISTFYLTKDPRKLGGRAVGPAGTPGSNNGGEKKGGTIQKKFADLTKKYSNKEKKNPIHICIAIAYDQHGSPHFSKFATSPIKHSDDFDMVRTTAEHPLEMANLGSNLLYMVFTSTDWKDMT